MVGGLMQIASYGSQDLFLTGTPEITFFKVVYRRHTNFAMESVRINFDNNVGFGTESVLTIPKVGDLVHKGYLEVIIPEIDFKRNDASNDNLQAFQDAQENYQIVLDFMSINRSAYVEAFDLFVAENTSSTDQMIQKINAIFNDVVNLETIQDMKSLLLTFTPSPPFKYEEISMQDVAEAAPDEIDKDDLFELLSIALDKSIKTQGFFFNDLLSKQEAHLDESNDNIKFAWINRIGHAIIKEITVMIGGQKIDGHLGDWINIWYELTANRDMEKIYNKMIGNVESLTTFDRSIKPSYRLKIPLQFWFCRHSGLSIPLVALQYHCVTVHVKFRNIEEVSYIENNKTIFVSQSKDLFLDEVPEELGINIRASILFDYIYLDSPERRRFAQSSHEYLIEQVQTLEVRDITQQSLQCVLNNFVHPTKEIIWVAQKESYTQNVSGYNRLQWDNYSINDNGKGGIIRFSSIDFHSYERVPRQPSTYFNYVQPYEVHNTTPADGINMYSFSIAPEEHQPSGSANMSRLSRVLLSMEFDPSLFIENSSETLTVRIYTRNVNILRVISGLAGLSYAYG